MYKAFIKRILDLLLAVIILLITLPLWIVLIVILYWKNKGAGIFFVQSRVGKANKVFEIYKFKTMTEERDEQGQLLPDELRLTKIGTFIRSTSLDELPQLLNVIKGDMSFIGPRPLLVDYIPLYSSYQARRHEIRPGITGWAQVNGRNSISWQRKFELDVWYVDNLSFFLDGKIFFLTITSVLKRQGISSERNVTMERFNGNN